MIDRDPYKPKDGDLVMWHDPRVTGRREARRGYFHTGPDGPYVIPEGGGGEEVPVGNYHVHRIDAQLPDQHCAWCPR
jgi:hypothetical protein